MITGTDNPKQLAVLGGLGVLAVFAVGRAFMSSQGATPVPTPPPPPQNGGTAAGAGTGSLPTSGATAIGAAAISAASSLARKGSTSVSDTPDGSLLAASTLPESALPTLPATQLRNPFLPASAITALLFPPKPAENPAAIAAPSAHPAAPSAHPIATPGGGGSYTAGLAAIPKAPAGAPAPTPAAAHPASSSSIQRNLPRPRPTQGLTGTPQPGATANPGMAPSTVPPAAPEAPDAELRRQVVLSGVLVGSYPSAFITIDGVQHIAHKGDSLPGGFHVDAIGENSITAAKGALKVEIRQ